MKTFKKLMVLSMMCLVMLCIAKPMQAEAAKPKLSKTKLTLTVGQKKTLKVKNTKKKVKWSSSAKKIASVTQKGVVTAKKAGIAKIYAKIGGKSYKCKVTVKELPVSISKKSMSMEIGESCTLKLNNAKKSITWESNKPSVAKVNKKGKVTAVSAGSTTITAKTNGKTYTCKVTVNRMKDILKVNSTSMTISKGESQVIDVTYLRPSGSIFYNIKDKSVVSCSWQGFRGNVCPLKITGKEAGTTTVTITNSYNSESVVITVNVECPVREIDIYSSGSDGKFPCVGESFKLEVSVYPSNATIKSIEWSSNNTSVATVDSNGVVLVIGTGKCVIVATSDNGCRDEYTIRVPEIEVRPGLPNLYSYVNGRTVYSTINVESADVSVEWSATEGVNLEINFVVQKVYDANGITGSLPCRMKYKLYDAASGMVVATGSLIETDLVVGDRTTLSLKEFSIPYGNYYLELMDYTL